MCQVLDICCMDIASRQFCSSVLAASALYLMSERYRTHLRLITGTVVFGNWHQVYSSWGYLLVISTIIGFELADIQLCVNWLQPFSAVINTQGRPAMLKYFKGVSLKCPFHTSQSFCAPSLCAVQTCRRNFQLDTYLLFFNPKGQSPGHTQYTGP